MVVLGFGGVFNNEGSLELNPLLPDAWSKLSFNIYWQGKKLHIDISTASIVVTIDSQEDFNISIFGKRYIFKEKLILKHEG
jgi:hypothetical glycosyl hydrolase